MSKVQVIDVRTSPRQKLNPSSTGLADPGSGRFLDRYRLLQSYHRTHNTGDQSSEDDDRQSHPGERQKTSTPGDTMARSSRSQSRSPPPPPHARSTSAAVAAIEVACLNLPSLQLFSGAWFTEDARLTRVARAMLPVPGITAHQAKLPDDRSVARRIPDLGPVLLTELSTA